jgi:hypothetical protein
MTTVETLLPALYGQLQHVEQNKSNKQKRKQQQTKNFLSIDLLDLVGINECKLDGSLDSEVQPMAPPMARLTSMAQLLTTSETRFTLMAQRMA